MSDLQLGLAIELVVNSVPKREWIENIDFPENWLFAFEWRRTRFKVRSDSKGLFFVESSSRDQLFSCGYNEAILMETLLNRAYMRWLEKRDKQPTDQPLPEPEA